MFLVLKYEGSENGREILAIFLFSCHCTYTFTGLCNTDVRFKFSLKKDVHETLTRAT